MRSGSLPRLAKAAAKAEAKAAAAAAKAANAASVTIATPPKAQAVPKGAAPKAPPSAEPGR